MYVVDKVVKKCREAVLGGIPILYVKTDSDMLIKKVTENAEKPFVLPICGSNVGARYTNRPCDEAKKGGSSAAPFNVGRDGDLLSDSETMSYPKCWIYKVPDKPDGAVVTSDVQKSEALFKNLEKYVSKHENANDPSYNFLQYSVVLLYSSNVNLPSTLVSYTEFIDVDYPDVNEIRDIILRESMNDANLTDGYISKLCTHFLGFSEEEIVLTIQKIRATRASFADSGAAEKIIFDKKKQKLEGGVLEYVKTDDSDASLGGMEGYTDWLDAQKEPLEDSNRYNREIGTPPPKGVLLCGIPGCGKSLAAKYTASVLKLPLLKMDIGSMMDRFQGVSEQRMRDALNLAEAMAPCVLFIDELEKAFSGTNNDNDTSFKRMFGYMLGWMQDNKKPCFIFATANDIGALPKEFFRSGRFEALYAVYLPTLDECVKILQACMEKAENSVVKAKGGLKEGEAVGLFGKGCKDERVLKSFINTAFVKDGKPRIVIGADLQKVVDTALRALAKKGRAEEITQRAWEEELNSAAEMCSVYGDGQENIDSIAVSYCRMLRKGFTPTGKVLFKNENYHAENLERLRKLKAKRTEDMNEDDKKKHTKELEEAQILQRGKKGRDGTIAEERPSAAYDAAVYDLLYARINDFALQIEQTEREKMIGR